MRRESINERSGNQSKQKKNARFRLKTGVFNEIRQLAILPGAMCQVLSPRTSLTYVLGMGTGGSSSPLSPEWLRLLDLKPSTILKKA